MNGELSPRKYGFTHIASCRPKFHIRGQYSIVPTLHLCGLVTALPYGKVALSAPQGGNIVGHSSKVTFWQLC